MVILECLQAIYFRRKSLLTTQMYMHKQIIPWSNKFEELTLPWMLCKLGQLQHQLTHHLFLLFLHTHTVWVCGYQKWVRHL